MRYFWHQNSFTKFIIRYKFITIIYKFFKIYFKFNQRHSKFLFKSKKNINQTYFNALLFHKEFLKKQSYPSGEQFNPVQEFEKILKKLKKHNECENIDFEEEKKNMRILINK